MKKEQKVGEIEKKVRTSRLGAKVENKKVKEENAQELVKGFVII